MAKSKPKKQKTNKPKVAKIVHRINSMIRSINQFSRDYTELQSRLVRADHYVRALILSLRAARLPKEDPRYQAIFGEAEITPLSETDNETLEYMTYLYLARKNEHINSINNFQETTLKNITVDRVAFLNQFKDQYLNAPVENRSAIKEELENQWDSISIETDAMIASCFDEMQSFMGIMDSTMAYGDILDNDENIKAFAQAVSKPWSEHCKRRADNAETFDFTLSEFEKELDEQYGQFYIDNKEKFDARLAKELEEIKQQEEDEKAGISDAEIVEETEVASSAETTQSTEE